MRRHELKSIELGALKLNLDNPRHPHQTSERTALETIASSQGPKLLRLAEDILEKGLDPSQVTMVSPTKDKKTFKVHEGNRRVAALKLLTSPTLAPSLDISKHLQKRFRSLYEEGGKDFPTAITCAVVRPEDAGYWILLKHTGEISGAGVVMWDGVSRERFRGSSPALQALDLVAESGLLAPSDQEKLQTFPITNLARILDSPDARSVLDVETEGGQLTLTDEDNALGSLALIVTDLVNRIIKVTDLDSTTQIVAYARQVVARPRLKVQPAGGKKASKTKTKKEPIRFSPARRHLIPRSFKLAIGHPRINAIYHELLSLSLERYPNGVSVMMRVFIELSVDHFASRQRISLKRPSAKGPVEMTLRQKLTTVAKFMEQTGVCTRHELAGVRALASSTHHVLSVDSLNAYVHNKDYHPTASELRSNWDSVASFVAGLWKK
jgi:hypothetical protein